MAHVWHAATHSCHKLSANERCQNKPFSTCPEIECHKYTEVNILIVFFPGYLFGLHSWQFGRPVPKPPNPIWWVHFEFNNLLDFYGASRQCRTHVYFWITKTAQRLIDIVSEMLTLSLRSYLDLSHHREASSFSTSARIFPIPTIRDLERLWVFVLFHLLHPLGVAVLNEVQTTQSDVQEIATNKKKL